ncbi:MAG: putative periplasmic serine endoprotease DegP-like precursor [Planctomycetota bacterium]|jgi:S1-C subfamily serine protease
MLRILCTLLLLAVCTAPLSAQQKKTRDQKVREDREKVTQQGFWLYNDLETGFEKARQTGRPLLVVLRCIPCEECVRLDDDLVDQDPILRPLLEQFVCVRVVSTNGLDLSLFQFDTDQSFAVFMLNADRTIYGRFGTRSHRTEWIGDVSLKGLAEALRGALELHRNWPASRDALAGKTGPAPQWSSPEKMPGLRDKYTSTINYSGEVAKSCIHCHQIGDAIRDDFRSLGEPIPSQVLNPYPHPRSLGLVLDPDSRATVKTVTPDSPADAAGFSPGDKLLTLNSQPLLSMADVQWVLHQTPAAGGQLEATVQRGNGPNQTITLNLQPGWRERDQIAWRVSAWGLRRMATGGLLLEEVPADERGQNGIPESGMALRVRHVGQFGPHAAAKNAGFQEGDVLLSFDGKRDLLTDSAVLRYGTTQKQPGDKVEVEIVRGGQRKMLFLPMQP